MKKQFIFAMTLAFGATVMTSCNKEENEVTGPKMSISLEQMEQSNEEGDKTIFDPTTKLFYWGTGDKLMVYDGDGRNVVYTDQGATAAYDYNNNTVSGSTRFVDLQPSTDITDQTNYTNIDLESSHYYAFYPSYYLNTAASNPSTGQFVFDLPTKQVIDNNKNVNKIKEMHLTRFPMARKTTSHSFEMKNMCGAIRLNLQKNGTSVKSIQFKALGQQQVSGTFNVTFNTSGVPQMAQTVANSTTRVVTLEMNQPVSIDQQQQFYIALPPATYNGFEIIITDATNKTATIKVSSDVTIARNQIRPLTVSNANFTGSRAFKDSHGKFSITSTQQVYIAPGNLQWNNHNWQFANEQFETMTTFDNCVRDPQMVWDAHNQDMFHYSLYMDSIYLQKYQYGYWNNGKLDISRRVENVKNNDFGRSFDMNDYNSTDVNTMINQGGKGGFWYYNNWGKAFGENSQWMVLSKEEFQYLFTGRINDGKCHCHVGSPSNPNASYCLIIMIDDFGKEHHGVLIFPDNWENGYTNESIADAFTWNNTWKINDNNVWSLSEMFMDISIYRILEEAGCAFLPITGYAKSWSANNVHLAGTICRNENNQGTYDGRLAYWTRSYAYGGEVTNMNPADTEHRTIGSNFYFFSYENNSFANQADTPDKFCAVRLCMPVPNE